MDKEILSRFLNQKIELVNDENFVLYGKIIVVYDGCIEFFTNGKTRVLSFERIKEIRPLGGRHDF